MLELAWPGTSADSQTGLTSTCARGPAEPSSAPGFYDSYATAIRISFGFLSDFFLRISDFRRLHRRRPARPGPGSLLSTVRPKNGRGLWRGARHGVADGHLHAEGKSQRQPRAEGLY